MGTSGCIYAISETLGVYLQFSKTPGVYSEFSQDVIAEFIYDEIYMHFGASQEIFTGGGKNLSAGVVQRF